MADYLLIFPVLLICIDSNSIWLLLSSIWLLILFLVSKSTIDLLVSLTTSLHILINELSPIELISINICFVPYFLMKSIIMLPPNLLSYDFIIPNILSTGAIFGQLVSLNFTCESRLSIIFCLIPEECVLALHRFSILAINKNMKISDLVVVILHSEFLILSIARIFIYIFHWWHGEA